MPKLVFLNVDLDMTFTEEPKVLLHELGRKVIVLYSGEHLEGHLVALELASFAKYSHITLRRWFKLLDSLSPFARQELQKASSRVFDLGFEIVSDKKAARIELTKEHLAALAKLEASYVVTLYDAGPELSVVKDEKRSRL